MNERDVSTIAITTDQGALGPWIPTASGGVVYLLRPKIEDIHLSDIAVSLSKQCRYNGNCKGHYSVARHCLLAEFHARRMRDDPYFCMAALLHDAAEAYLGDVVTPIKNALGRDEYEKMEDALQRVIFRYLGMGLRWDDWKASRELLEIDHRLAVTEKRDLTLSGEDVEWVNGENLEPFAEPIVPEKARNDCLTFLATWSYLVRRILMEKGLI